MKGDNAGDDDDKGAGGPTNLGFGAAQQRDQKTSNDCAINAGLRSESGGDGKSHGQRQGDQSYCDPGDQIVKKFVGVVAPETKHRLRKPALVGESISHFSIMQQTPAGKEKIEGARTP